MVVREGNLRPVDVFFVVLELLQLENMLDEELLQVLVTKATRKAYIRAGRRGEKERKEKREKNAFLKSARGGKEGGRTTDLMQSCSKLLTPKFSKPKISTKEAKGALSGAPRHVVAALAPTKRESSRQTKREASRQPPTPGEAEK